MADIATLPNRTPGSAEAKLDDIWARLLLASDRLDWLDQDGFDAVGYRGSVHEIHTLRDVLLERARHRATTLALQIEQTAHSTPTVAEEWARVTRVLRFLSRVP